MDEQSPSGEGAQVEGSRSVLRWCVAPRQQFVDAGDFVIGDPAEDVGEPSLWVDIVQLGGFDQRIGDRGRLAATLGTDKEVVLAPDGNGLHGALGRIMSISRKP